jgi:hypothetical protein
MSRLPNGDDAAFDRTVLFLDSLVATSEKGRKTQS